MTNRNASEKWLKQKFVFSYCKLSRGSWLLVLILWLRRPVTYPEFPYLSALPPPTSCEDCSHLLHTVTRWLPSLRPSTHVQCERGQHQKTHLHLLQESGKLFWKPPNFCLRLTCQNFVSWPVLDVAGEKINIYLSGISGIKGERVWR